MSLRRKSNWPHPDVPGLVTRRQAAQEPVLDKDSAPPTKPQLKAPLSQVQNNMVPKTDKKAARAGKSYPPPVLDDKIPTPKTATPTLDKPKANEKNAKAKGASKAGADKAVVEAGNAAPNKTPDTSKTPADDHNETDKGANKEASAEEEHERAKSPDVDEKKDDEPTSDDKNAEGEGEQPKSVSLDDLDFDLSFLDDDLLAAALGGTDDEGEGSVPGPLPAPLQAIWDAFMSACAEFVVKFSGASRKTTQILWNMLGEEFKLTRNPNIYNMWVKKWSLLNGMEEGETKHEYHRRYVDAYHDAMDNMTAEEKKNTRIELLDWLRGYEQECAKEAERRGLAFKGVLDTKQSITRTVQHLARKNNCVIWGVVVPLKHGDAKSIAAGRSFCSHDGMTTVLKDLGVNVDDLCGDIAVGFGAKYLANRLLDDWSDEALYEVLKKIVNDRRFYLRRSLLAIWNVGLKVQTDNLTWKGNASVCVKRGVWFDNWPRGIDPPDVIGDNKYSESDHNTLMEATYKTLRKEPGFAHIEVKPYTEEELSWRRKDWKRWCALPVYRDTDGKILIHVRDVMPDEEVDIKLKGRVPRIRISAVSKSNTSVASEDANGNDDDIPVIAPVTNATLLSQKRRRSVEQYAQLLEGGGSKDYFQVMDPPAPKRRAVKPPYLDVEEMVDETDEMSVGPSSRASSVAPGLTLEGLQQQMMVAQRQQAMQSQQMMAAMLQQMLGRGVGMAGLQTQQQQQQQMPQMPQQQQMGGNANWTLAQQQQLPLPSFDDWVADGQGGFMSLNGN